MSSFGKKRTNESTPLLVRADEKRKSYNAAQAGLGAASSGDARNRSRVLYGIASVCTIAILAGLYTQVGKPAGLGGSASTASTVGFSASTATTVTAADRVSAVKEQRAAVVAANDSTGTRSGASFSSGGGGRLGKIYGSDGALDLTTATEGVSFKIAGKDAADSDGADAAVGASLLVTGSNLFATIQDDEQPPVVIAAPSLKGAFSYSADVSGLDDISKVPVINVVGQGDITVPAPVADEDSAQQASFAAHFDHFGVTKWSDEVQQITSLGGEADISWGGAAETSASIFGTNVSGAIVGYGSLVSPARRDLEDGATRRVGESNVFLYADVDARDAADLGFTLSETADDAARTMYAVHLQRPETNVKLADETWRVVHSEFVAGVGVSFADEGFSMDVRGTAPTPVAECTDSVTEASWIMRGVAQVPAMGVEGPVPVSPVYNCAIRQVTTQVPTSTLAFSVNGVMFKGDVPANEIVVESYVNAFPGDLGAEDSYKSLLEWNATADVYVGAVAAGTKGYLAVNIDQVDVAVSASSVDKSATAAVTGQVSFDAGAGITVSGSALFNFPCAGDSVMSDVRVTSSEDLTGFSLGPEGLTAKMTTPCAGTNGKTIVSVEGAIEKLSISNGVVLTDLILTLTATGAADNLKWNVAIAASAAATSSSSTAKDLLWSGGKWAMGSKVIKTSASFNGDALSLDANGDVSLGKCSDEKTIRARLSGAANVNFAGDDDEEFGVMVGAGIKVSKAKMIIRCADVQGEGKPSKKSASIYGALEQSREDGAVMDAAFDDGESINQETFTMLDIGNQLRPEAAEFKVDEQLRTFLDVEVTGASTTNGFLVADAVAISSATSDFNVSLPISDASSRSGVTVEGVIKGRATIEGPIPGIEGLAQGLKGASSDFNVTVSTDENGAVRAETVTLILEKFSIQNKADASLGHDGLADTDGAATLGLPRKAGTSAATLGEDGAPRRIVSIDFEAGGVIAYPCRVGSNVMLPGKVSLAFGSFEIQDHDSTVTYFCGRRGNILPAINVQVRPANDDSEDGNKLQVTPSVAFDTAIIQVRGFLGDDGVLNFAGVVKGIVANDPVTASATLGGVAPSKSGVFEFDSALATAGFTSRVEVASEYASMTLNTRLKGTSGGRCASSDNARDALSGTMEIFLPDMSDLSLAARGWMACSWSGDEGEALLEFSAPAGQVQIDKGTGATLVINDVSVITRGYREVLTPDQSAAVSSSRGASSSLGAAAPAPVSPAFASAADFGNLTFFTSVEGVVDGSRVVGLPDFGANINGSGYAGDVNASMTTRWTDGAATATPIKVSGEIKYAGHRQRKSFTVTGSASFDYPCEAGQSIPLTDVTASIDIPDVLVVTADDATASAFCSVHVNTTAASRIDALVAEGVAVAAVEFTASSAYIGHTSLGSMLKDVTISAHVFRTTQTRRLGHSFVVSEDRDAESDASFFALSLEGSIRGTVADGNDLQGEKLSYLFDTRHRDINIAEQANMITEALTLDLAAAMVTPASEWEAAEQDCNLESGHAVAGTGKLNMGGSKADAVQFAITGVRHCGILHAEAMRKNLDATSVQVTSVHAMVSERIIRPVNAFDGFLTCARSDNKCGAGASNRVCPAGMACVEGTCTAATPETSFDKFGNNFAGACSRCSADSRCGEEAGNTVCHAGKTCDASGQCVDGQGVAFKIGEMAQFSDNYGAACPVPTCSRDGMCGPMYGGAVCPAGEICAAEGSCQAKAALGGGDDDDDALALIGQAALTADYSDNHGNACTRGGGGLCAHDNLCGPENGYQVCMSGAVCVSGRCVAGWTFQHRRFSEENVQMDYSDNARGECHGCAAGAGAVCGPGDDNGLVCPGDLVCAKHPIVKKEKAEKTEGVDDETIHLHGGRSVSGFQTGTAASPFDIFISKMKGTITSPPFNVHVCMTRAEVKSLNVKPEDVDTPTVDEKRKACSRPDLVSQPYVVERSVDQHTLGDSKDVKAIGVKWLIELCGPRFGGLVCSSADMVCAAREGLCVPEDEARDRRVTMLPEYSFNHADVADDKTSMEIETKREKAEATMGPLTRLASLADAAEYGDFPTYDLRMVAPELNFKSGDGNAVRATGIKMTAYGAITDKGVKEVAVDASPGDFMLESMEWGGEISGTLDIEGSNPASVPQVDGDLRVITAWTMSSDDSDFKLTPPLVASGEIRASFGGALPASPAATFKGSSAFPVPCVAGETFTAVGALVLSHLGGGSGITAQGISGAAQAVGTFFCGKIGANDALGDISAYLGNDMDGIESAGFFSVRDVSLIATLLPTAPDAPKGDMRVRAKGVLRGSVVLVSLINGLTVSPAVIAFGGSGNMAASTLLDIGASVSVSYSETDINSGAGVTFRASGVVPVGRACNPEGMQLQGKLSMSTHPFNVKDTPATFTRHCEGATAATKKHGYVWRVDALVERTYVFENKLAIGATNVSMTLRGRQTSDPKSDVHGAAAVAWDVTTSGKLNLRDIPEYGFETEGLPNAVRDGYATATFKSSGIVHSQNSSTGDVVASASDEFVIDANVRLLDPAGLIVVASNVHFSYPCRGDITSGSSDTIAKVTFKNVGGLSGTDSKARATFSCVSHVPQAAVASVKAKLGNAEIVFSAYMNGEGTQFYFLGTASTGGKIQAFDTRAPAAMIDVSPEVTLKTPSFDVSMQGVDCAPGRGEMTFMRSAITITDMNVVPFKTPAVVASGTKSCHASPGIPVYTLIASFDDSDLSGLKNKQAALGASDSVSAVTRSFTVKISAREEHTAHAEGEVLHALRREVQESDIAHVEETRVRRQVTMKLHVTGEGMSAEAWDEHNGAAFVAFHAELAERLGCPQEDVEINTSSLVDGGVVVNIKAKVIDAAIHAPFSERATKHHRKRAAMLGSGYGAAAAVTAAAKAVDAKQPDFEHASPPVVSALVQMDVHMPATSAIAVDGWSPSAALARVAKIHEARISAGPVQAQLGQSNKAAPTSLDPSQLTVDRLVIVARGFSDDGAPAGDSGIRWELEVSGAAKVKSSLNQPIPSILASDTTIDIFFKSDGRSAGDSASLGSGGASDLTTALNLKGENVQITGSLVVPVPCPVSGMAKSSGLSLSLDDLAAVSVAGAASSVSLSCANTISADALIVTAISDTASIAVGPDVTITEAAIKLQGHAKSSSAAIDLDQLYYTGHISGQLGAAPKGVTAVALVDFDTREGSDANVIIEGTFTRKFGGVTVSLKGRGKVKPSCNTLGDLYLDGEATATNLPKFVKSVTGKARYLSDCGTDSKVIIEVNWDDNKMLMVQLGIKLMMPKWGLFRVDEKYKAGSYAKGMSFAMPFGTNGVFRLAYYPPFKKDWLVETLFNEGTVCDAFADALQVIPFLEYLPNPCSVVRDSPFSFVASLFDEAKMEGMTFRFALHGGFNHIIFYVKGLHLFSDILKMDIGFAYKQPSDQKLNTKTTLAETDTLLFGEIRIDRGLISKIPLAIKIPLMLACGQIMFIKAAAFMWTTFRILEMAAPAKAMFPSYIYDLQPGITLFMVYDLLSAFDEVSAGMLKGSESTAKGDDGSSFDINAKKNTVRDYLSNFAVHIVLLGDPVKPEAPPTGFCIGHPFRMIDPFTGEFGITSSPGTWWSLKVLICVQWKPKPATGFVIESVQTVDTYEGDLQERILGLARKRTIVMRTRFEMMFMAEALSFKAFFSAKMKKYGQYLMNPGGAMPKGGLIFPLNIALGVKIMYSGIGSNVVLFTFEGGIFACSKSIQMKRKKTAELGDGGDDVSHAQEEGGVFQKAFGDDYASKVRHAGFNDADSHHGFEPYTNQYIDSAAVSSENMVGASDASSEESQESTAKRQLLYTDNIRYDLDEWGKRAKAEQSAVVKPPSPPSPPPALPPPPNPPPPLYKPARMLLKEPTDYECTNDPYGKLPAIFKVAVFIDNDKNKVAFFYVIRRLTIGRLLYIFAPEMLYGIIDTIRPIVDLIKFEKLECSFNNFGHPVRIYGGSRIMGGMYVMIENFDFFGLIKARFVQVNFNEKKGILKVQVFVDPITIEIGGFKLIEIRGVLQEDKFTAKQAIAERAAQDAIMAAESRRETAKMYKKLKVSEGRKICPKDADSCGVCARIPGPGKLVLDCIPDSGYVIGNILDASWSEVRNNL